VMLDLGRKMGARERDLADKAITSGLIIMGEQERVMVILRGRLGGRQVFRGVGTARDLSLQIPSLPPAHP
jgi:hypothetical protein